MVNDKVVLLLRVLGLDKQRLVLLLTLLALLDLHVNYLVREGVTRLDSDKRRIASGSGMP